MYEASVTLRQGEIRPLYAQATAAQGDTITLLTAPAAPYSAPTFTLLDNTGTPLAGWNGAAIPAANCQTSALAAPLLWFVLNTGGISAGVYVARFAFAARSTQDGITRTLVCEVQIRVLAALEMTATYDPSTPGGQTRLYCLDSDMTQPVFSDAEIAQFLSDGGGIPLLGAALALDVLAADYARLANAVKIGTFGNSEAGAYQAIMERAAHLRGLALVTPVVASPAPVFANDTW